MVHMKDNSIAFLMTPPVVLSESTVSKPGVRKSENTVLSLTW